MRQRPARSPLAALSAAAAALPGYAVAVDAEVGYRFSYYVEDDLAGSKAASGQASERYEIQTHQLSHEVGLSEDWTLSTDVMVETLSGASPWFVVPDSRTGQPVQIMSGATIQEERYALYGKAWRDRQQDHRLGLAAGISKENDYQAVSAGLEGQWDYDQKRVTFSAGVGVSSDQITPTDGGSEQFPNRPVDESKRSATLYAGISRVLSPQTQAQFSMSYAVDLGYLSDPYKLVSIAGRVENDSRPDSRSQYALGFRLRHYLAGLRTVLRGDWRHFRDDWDIVSDTVEIGTLSRLGSHLRLSTTLRWYQQSRADFYAGYFQDRREDGYHSSDYRLSPYGALSGRLGLDYLGPRWQVALAAESYASDGDYALRQVATPSPGLVDFVIYTLAVGYSFGGGGR